MRRGSAGGRLWPVRAQISTNCRSPGRVPRRGIGVQIRVAEARERGTREVAGGLFAHEAERRGLRSSTMFRPESGVARAWNFLVDHAHAERRGGPGLAWLKWRTSR